ncbi:MAG: hypothetical protein R3199_05355 [Gemmatimonadota bacterium]|nr:hypothetical protein [Gemmatimonadota bacterium]
MRLHQGDVFPRLAGPAVDRGELALPDDFESDWNVVLAYRGHF